MKPAMNGIDLNTATSEELANLAGIGPDKAWDIIQHRPYSSWEDLKRVPGFDSEMLEVLQRSGAAITFQRSQSL